ncbi:MAG: hypothetical protein AABX48_01130 [Nanoarchaeota archaeon]
MKKEVEERTSFALRQKGDDLIGYKSHEINNFIAKEDIIGLDANVLVDIIESDEFKEEIKIFVSLELLKIYTTNTALGEARHVLIKKRNYSFERATSELNKILKEFNIKKIKHNPEINIMAEELVNEVKRKMYLNNIHTFPNDFRILINLIEQAEVNLYITEDKDIKKAAKLLGLPIRVKIIGEASNLSGYKIKEFFKENRRVRRRK